MPSSSPKIVENIQVIPPDQTYNTLATLEMILKNPGTGDTVQIISPNQSYNTYTTELVVVKGVSDSVSVS